VPRGANGGYLAAIIVRAVEAEVADPGRPFRSLTLHYLRPPENGPLEVSVAVERQGRTLTSVTARASQDGRPCVLAVGALAGDFGSTVEFAEAMPQVEPASAIEPWPVVEEMPPVARRVEMRPAIGGTPFAGGQEPCTGGWIRLREPHPYDAALLAFLSDVWLPPTLLSVVDPIGVPTIDLTIHFRNPQAALEASPGEPVLGAFESRFAAGSFVEEDAQLWSPGGVLLAQSRQLAALLPPR
jgi:acyl-CoA thioesterase